MGGLLDRAIALADRVESLEATLADMRVRLKAALGADPATAVQALGWLTRCRNAEALLMEIVDHLDMHPVTARDLPDGWEPRARAQVRAARVAERVAREVGFDRIEDEDYWVTVRKPDHREPPHGVTVTGITLPTTTALPTTLLLPGQTFNFTVK